MKKKIENNKDALLKKVGEMKKDLYGVRFNFSAKNKADTAKTKNLKKDIARRMTALSALRSGKDLQKKQK